MYRRGPPYWLWVRATRGLPWPGDEPATSGDQGDAAVRRTAWSKQSPRRCAPSRLRRECRDPDGDNRGRNASPA